MQESSTRKIYDVHSVFYDATFGRLVRRRIARAISHMNLRQNDRVLDLGIGTGVSLNFYPKDRGKIVGIDLSAGMLREARKKMHAQERQNVTVFQADAMRLPFGDNTFDYVFISHVISVVSDPYRLVQEAQRVAKAGPASSSSIISSRPIDFWRCWRNGSARSAPSWVGEAIWRCRI